MEICNYIYHIDAEFLRPFGAGEDSDYKTISWHTHDKPQQCKPSSDFFAMPLAISSGTSQFIGYLYLSVFILFSFAVL